jgi:acetyl esterase
MEKITLEHALMAEEKVKRFLRGHVVRLGGREMDPKAQVVAEFVKSIRVPGYFPPIKELRQQLVQAVQLLDEPPVQIVRKDDIQIPAKAGNLLGRVYAPKLQSSELLPVLLYYHGGGWVQGDLDTHDGLCSRLALWSGAMVVALDYRLAPEYKFPIAVEDCLSSYQWLINEGQAIGADPYRVAVGGDSAGGNLAAVVSQLAEPADFPEPLFQLLLYPATDLEFKTNSHSERKNDEFIPRDRMEWYLEQYLNNPEEKKDYRASPGMNSNLAGQPPSLIIVGGFDPLRDDARLYAEKLSAAGVDVIFHEYTGQIHAFMTLTKAIPAGLQATREVADYMRRRFALGVSG